MKDYNRMLEMVNVNNHKTYPSHFSKNHLCGWKQIGDDYDVKNYPQDKEIKYSLSYKDTDGEKYAEEGKILAPDTNTARIMLEGKLKASGYKKIWVCIYKKVKMEVFDGNGM